MNIQRLIKLGIINDKFENLSKSEQIISNILSTLNYEKHNFNYINYYDENNNVLLTYANDERTLVIHSNFINKFMDMKNVNSPLSDNVILIQHSLLHIFNSRLGFNLDVII